MDHFSLNLWQFCSNGVVAFHFMPRKKSPLYILQHYQTNALWAFKEMSEEKNIKISATHIFYQNEYETEKKMKSDHVFKQIL